MLDHLPIQRRKIIFLNFNGRGWGDNPKYIAKELLNQHLNYDLVWLTSSLSALFPEGVRKVKMPSWKARYELATAHVIINNVKNALPQNKKKGQYYIQTWHGDFPLKFIEKEVEDYLSPEYVRESKQNSRDTDLIISGSGFFSSIIKNSFWYNGEVFESGLPRNDIYFSQDEELINTIRNYFPISKDSSILLYAPTFRDKGTSFKIPNLCSIIETLTELTNKKWVIIVRFHPNDYERKSEVNYSEQILDGSAYPDPQELSKIADLLITDYSSIIYDFSIQNKPVVLYAPDLNEYMTQGRGLRPIYKELPYCITKNDKEIKEALKMLFPINKDNYSLSPLPKLIQSFDDGHASERIVNRIKSIISK